MPEPITQLAAELADRYVIEGQLGTGGMATVYLARDLKHDREVAIKVLRPELAAILGRERFLAEIRLTARLDHPHILTLIDSGEAGGVLYYVLPRVRGESLRARLQREPQLPVTDALSIARQVAGALDYAHSRGVIHRDIKPENILLHEGEAVLADFGIALAVREAGGQRLTETGLSLGTPQYMSPEQATGEKNVDRRSDIYSLASVLYELLAGEPPHTGPTTQAVIAKLMTTEPVELRVLRPAVPEAVAAAVSQALAKTPADRFATAGAFVDALNGNGGTTRRVLHVRLPGRTVLSAGAAGVAIVGALWILSTRSHAVPKPLEPYRVQLTFSGDTHAPSLSPDGTRLASGFRICDSAGRCTMDVVIRDLGGAGAVTVARGLRDIWKTRWTQDGRYLLFTASVDTSKFRVFSVPTLGGVAPRSLGCCDFGLASGDTALVATGFDAVAWVKTVTLGDGLVQDSFPVQRPLFAQLLTPEAIPGSALVGLVTFKQFLVADRTGRVLDSLDFSYVATNGGPEVHALPDGSGVVAVLPRSVPDEYDLVRYPVDAAGRLGKADTLLRRQQMSLRSLGQGGVSLSADGTLLFMNGQTDYEVWLLRRNAPGSLRFTRRRLAAGTAPVEGVVSPSGDRVLLVRTVLAGNEPHRAMFLVPIDSGAEAPVAGQIDSVMNAYNAFPEWTLDEQAVLLTSARGENVTVTRLELKSGRPRQLGRTRVAEPAVHTFALPGDGYGVLEDFPRRLHVTGIPGRADTSYVLPPLAGNPYLFDAALGTTVIAAGWGMNVDTVLVNSIELSSGTTTRLATMPGLGMTGLRRFPNGAVELIVAEGNGSAAWYSMPANGGVPIRLGSAPYPHAFYDQSADGTHIVVSLQNFRPDAYQLRNFAELIKRR